MSALEKFLEYVKIDTQADDKSGLTPSTEKQKNLSRLLVKHLKELGLDDAYMDEYGIVYGHLDGEGDVTIGFNAHVDTALEVSDFNANPRIVYNYQGEDVKLNDIYTLTTKQFPSLNKHIGHDLVVTDGTTLLGADDKAGIAIIMGMLEYFHDHPEIKHVPLAISFTVDEEIGEGPLHFSLEKMKADYAYTIDGALINQIDYENFNAQQVFIDIEGVSVHPGEGKNALINAIVLLNEFISAFPSNETPFDSEDYQGYWHMTNVKGNSDKVHAEMILREFDIDKLNARNAFIFDLQKKLQNKYPKAKIEIDIHWQYENMAQYVKKDPRPLERATKAIIENGLTPNSAKIRGGTDGATFSKMGLVTPNLGTGSYNHHGRYEYLDIQEFNKMIDIIVTIATYTK